MHNFIERKGVLGFLTLQERIINPKSTVGKFYQSLLSYVSEYNLLRSILKGFLPVFLFHIKKEEGRDF